MGTLNSDRTFFSVCILPEVHYFVDYFFGQNKKVRTKYKKIAGKLKILKVRAKYKPKISSGQIQSTHLRFQNKDPSFQVRCSRRCGRRAGRRAA